MDPATSSGTEPAAYGRSDEGRTAGAPSEEMSDAMKSLGLDDVAGLVWGPRQEAGDRVVIPVARVTRGGRLGRWRGMVVEPLGALELSPRGTRFVPVVSVNRIVATVFAAVFGFVGLVTLGRLLTSGRSAAAPVAQAARAATMPQGNRAKILSPTITFAPTFSPELEIEDVRVGSPSFQDAFKR